MLNVTLSHNLFEQYRGLILKLTGVSLAESRLHFVAARLRPRLQKCGCRSFEEYFELLTSANSQLELMHFFDEITTHHTFFFREGVHFDHLAEDLRARLEKGQQRFRIWSAACSTGEEPYSLLITLAERLGEERLRGLDLKVLATDVSVPVIRRAAAGVYSAEHLRNVSPERVRKYFQRHERPRRYEAAPWLRQKVTHRELNLISKSFPMRGPFDAVFCRNVLIYFEPQTQVDVLRRVSALVAPGGLLYVGMTESALHADLDLSFAGPAVYRRDPRPSATSSGGGPPLANPAPPGAIGVETPAAASPTS